MFQKENELVNKLVLDLQERFGTRYILKELRSGNNIADITFAIDINRKTILFDEYLYAYYYFTTIYPSNKVELSDIHIDNAIYNKFRKFLIELEELGYIEINGSCVKSIKKVDAVTTNLVAIEAKISDWKSGLEQAKRYKQYADTVYVALSSEFIKKVDIDVFKTYNIGLMSVSNGKLKIPLKPKKEKTVTLDIKYYVADKFLRQLQYMDLVMQN